MKYYQHHIGDFNNGTRHLTRVERSLYRDMLELYYDTEQPLNSDINKLARRILAHTEEEREAMLIVLEEFFVLQDDGWHNARCDAEIAKYQEQVEQASRAGKASAAKRLNKDATESKERATPVQPSFNERSTPVQPTINHKPITNTPTDVGVARTPEAEACLAMKAAGMASVNPSNPKLSALLNAGITVPELSAAAGEAAAKGKPFAYALAVAEGRRRDAATAPLPDAMPDAMVETYAQRAARQRMEEVAPMAARKAPSSAFEAAQRFIHGEVIDVSPDQKRLQVA